MTETPVEYKSPKKQPTGSLPEELLPEIDRIVRKYPYSDSSLLFKSELLDLAERCYREGAEQMRDVIMLAGVEIDGKDYIPWQDAERRSREFFEDEDTHAE